MKKKPQVHLLFGFLGSGKTTLVRHLLSAGSDVPTAVVVNEFGDIGFDGEIIERNSVDTIELISGCICCTLKGSLLSAVEELAEEAGAQRIIVESTGVADPDSMLDDFEAPEVTKNFTIAPIVTVVDISFFEKCRELLGDFYLSQIINADILVLNKIDLVHKRVMQKITPEIQEINPEANLYFAEQCDIDPEFVFTDGTTTVTRSDSEHGHNHHHDHDHHHVHDSMMSFVMNPKQNLSRSDLDNFCDKLPDSVWRVKGHMLLDGQQVMVQYSGGRLDVSESITEGYNRMVVIGQSLDADQLADGFGSPIVTSANI